jgi:hypothetical protein
LPLPDGDIVFFLLGKPQDVIVAAGVGVVAIGDFRKVFYLQMAHLEDRKADGHVVSSLEVFTCRVAEIRLLYIQEERSVE